MIDPIKFISTCSTAHEVRVPSLQTQIPSTHNLKLNAQLNNSTSCRICLQECNNIMYCYCTGSLLCHEKCLIYYLQNSTNKENPKCEICKYKYKITYDCEYEASITHLIRRIHQQKSKCMIYSIVFFLTLSFYIGMLISLIKLGNQNLTLLLSLAACVSLIFVPLLIYWAHEFLIIKKQKVKHIQPLKKKIVRRNNRVARLQVQQL